MISKGSRPQAAAKGYINFIVTSNPKLPVYQNLEFRNANGGVQRSHHSYGNGTHKPAKLQYAVMKFNHSSQQPKEKTQLPLRSDMSQSYNYSKIDYVATEALALTKKEHEQEKATSKKQTA